MTKKTLEKAIRQAKVPVVNYIMDGDGGLDQLEKDLQLM